MLTEPYNLKAIIPKKLEETIKFNVVAKFTNKITKYSELISNSKKTSAVNSKASLLSKTLTHDQQMSTSDKRNMTTRRSKLFHTYKTQVQVKKEVHAKKYERE